MRSRMIAIAVGFLCAAWLPQVIPVLGCICIALLTLVFAFYRRSTYNGVLLCFIAALLYASCWGSWQLSHKLPDQLLRSDWIVTGTLVDLPDSEAGVIRFNFKVDSMALHRLPNGSHNSPEIQKLLSDLNVRLLKLSWYKPSNNLIPGQYLKLAVRIKPPHGLVNPSGFDYERWLLINKIDATGYVREVIDKETDIDGGIAGLRHAMNQRIEQRYSESRDMALVQALTTGYKANFSQDDWELLRQSGTVHLAVISGLHIGFVALIGWWLGRVLSVLSPRFYGLPYCLSVLFAGIYMQVAGAEIPTQRAFIMVFVFMLSGLLKWYIDIWQRWWLALVCVLIFTPLAVLEVGFWLSFCAVALLIWFSQQPIRWYGVIKIQFLLLLGMLPLYLHFFSAISLVAPLVNIIAIPLLSILIVVIAINLAVSFFSISFFDGVERNLVDLFWTLVDLSAAQEWSYLTLDPPPLAVIVVAAIGALILLLPSGSLPKYMAVFFFLPLLGDQMRGDDLDTSPVPETSRLSAIVFDIGQGLSVVVEVGTYRLLYDTGPAYLSGSTAFERAVLPYLTQARIKQLEHMVLSHDDNDHVGGFSAVKKAVHIEQVFSSFDLSGEYDRSCKRGVKWRVGGVDFEFLSGSTGRNDNNRSCVLLVSDVGCSLLLPGDIGKSVEASIVKRHQALKVNGPVTWLVASHHGSRSSSSELWLTATSPENIIFSAGYANAFNHPHPEVVKRAKAYGAQVYTTAKTGAVFLKSDAEGECTTTTMRQDEKRFWR